MAESRRRTQRRSTASGSAAAETAAGKQSGNLQDEYSYVFKDLRQLAIVSGAIFLLLFVVGYFI